MANSQFRTAKDAKSAKGAKKDIVFWELEVGSWEFINEVEADLQVGLSES